MRRFFVPPLPPLRVGDLRLLDAAAANHLVRVLRASVGDSIAVFDGQRRVFAAQVTAISAGRDPRVEFVCERVLAEDRESPLPVVLAVALGKHDKLDWVVEKATELGAIAVQPLLSARTEVKVDALDTDKQRLKLAHWHKIVIAACQQSGRSVVPVVLPPLDVTHWLRQLSDRPAGAGGGGTPLPRHAGASVHRDPCAWPTPAAWAAVAAAGYPGAPVPPTPSPTAVSAAHLFAASRPARPGVGAGAPSPPPPPPPLPDPSLLSPVWHTLQHEARQQLLLVCDTVPATTASLPLARAGQPTRAVAAPATASIGSGTIHSLVHGPLASLFFHGCDAAAPTRSHVLLPAAQLPVVHCVIGPEGGWTDAERAALLRPARDAPYMVHAVALGPRVLRYETAAVAALTAVHAHTGLL